MAAASSRRDSHPKKMLYTCIISSRQNGYVQISPDGPPDRTIGQSGKAVFVGTHIPSHHILTDIHHRSEVIHDLMFVRNVK